MHVDQYATRLVLGLLLFIKEGCYFREISLGLPQIFSTLI